MAPAQDYDRVGAFLGVCLLAALVRGATQKPATTGADGVVPVATSKPAAAAAASTHRTPAAAASTALTELAALAVKGRAPMTGYSRGQFGPAWPEIGGCDERNDTLARDLTAIAMKTSCVIASGTARARVWPV